MSTDSSEQRLCSPAVDASISGDVLVHCGTATHKDLYKTLNLLKINTLGDPIYFVVEGLGTLKDGESYEDFQGHQSYFYEEHTCPTNFVGPHSEGYGVVALYEGGDRDPHGVFRFVRAVWMPQRYVDAKQAHHERGHNMGITEHDVLEDLFPELTEGHPRQCLHQTPTSVSTHMVQPGEVCNEPNRVSY